MEELSTDELLDNLKDVQEFQELVKIERNHKIINTFYLLSGNERFKVIFKENNVFHDISVLIKFAPRSIIIRERFAIEIKFRKECFFYSNLLPKMANKIGMPELTDLFPKCYYSSGKAPKEFLVLRDVSPEGFQSIETPLKVDLGSLQLALTALAKFHAAGIVFKWNHKEEFNYVSNRFMVAQNLHYKIQDILVDQMKDRGIEAARRDGIKISKDFENKFSSIFMKFSKCIRETSPWYTIAHGDAVINNFMFNETQAKLVDLQMLCCASVGYDLVSLIYISTEKEFRDKYLDSLFVHYYNEITCTISRLTNLSKDDLKKRGLDLKSLKRNFQLHLPLAYRICSYFLGILSDAHNMKDQMTSEESEFEGFVLRIKNLNLGGQKVDRRLIDIVKEIIDANVVDELYEIF